MNISTIVSNCFIVSIIFAGVDNVNANIKNWFDQPDYFKLDLIIYTKLSNILLKVFSARPK